MRKVLLVAATMAALAVAPVLDMEARAASIDGLQGATTDQASDGLLILACGCGGGGGGDGSGSDGSSREGAASDKNNSDPGSGSTDEELPE